MICNFKWVFQLKVTIPKVNLMEAERMWNGYVSREQWMQRNLDNAQALLNDLHGILLKNETHSDVLNLRNAEVQRTPTKVYLSYRMDMPESGEVWGIGFDALADCWFMQQEGETQRLQGDRDDLWDNFFHQAFVINQSDLQGKSLQERLDN